MAVILDGTTYEGFWKIVGNDATPNDFYLIPKNNIFFSTSASRIYFTSDFSAGTPIVNTGADTEDGEGNVLATADEVSTYLSNLR